MANRPPNLHTIVARLASNGSPLILPQSDYRTRFQIQTDPAADVRIWVGGDGTPAGDQAQWPRLRDGFFEAFDGVLGPIYIAVIDGTEPYVSLISTILEPVPVVFGLPDALDCITDPTGHPVIAPDGRQICTPN